MKALNKPLLQEVVELLYHCDTELIQPFSGGLELMLLCHRQRNLNRGDGCLLLALQLLDDCPR